MKSLLTLLICMVLWTSASAHDLIITNGRIIDGLGNTIENGSIAIRDGLIASITTGPTGGEDVLTIDARGMSVMPGFIDTHRHDYVQQLRAIESENDLMRALSDWTPGNMQSLLAAGFTTVMMPGIQIPAMNEIRARIKAGSLQAPRLLFTGPTFTSPGDHPAQGPVCGGVPYCAGNIAIQTDDPAFARQQVRRLAANRVDAIKAVVDRRIVPSTTLDFNVLAAIIDESKAHGLPVMLHVATVDDMNAVAQMGADRLVHTPLDRAIEGTIGARLLTQSRIPISTTVSFSSPQFAEFLNVNYTRGEAHKQVLANIRYLWDEGAIVAFGTDSPPVSPMVEIEQLAKVLSPAEIVTALTLNGAIYLDLADEIGTLETGKIADITIVEGDPLDVVGNLGNVKLVLRNGEIVVDNR